MKYEIKRGEKKEYLSRDPTVEKHCRIIITTTTTTTANCKWGFIKSNLILDDKSF